MDQAQQLEALLQEWHRNTGAIIGVNGNWFRLLAAFLLESKLFKTLELKARYADNAPFCPNHRDKVTGKPCRECEIERLRKIGLELASEEEYYQRLPTQVWDDSDPGKCPDCNKPHQWVRPGKTQPTCDCEETCSIHGRNKVVYHREGELSNVSGYFCMECQVCDAQPERTEHSLEAEMHLEPEREPEPLNVLTCGRCGGSGKITVGVEDTQPERDLVAELRAVMCLMPGLDNRETLRAAADKLAALRARLYAKDNPWKALYGVADKDRTRMANLLRDTALERDDLEAKCERLAEENKHLNDIISEDQLDAHKS